MRRCDIPENALPNISPPLALDQTLGKVELVSPSCDACCNQNVSRHVHSGVTMVITTLLQKAARQIAGALRRTNTVICASIYSAENSSKSNQ